MSAATGRPVEQGRSCRDPDRTVPTGGVVGRRYVVLTAQPAVASRPSATQCVTTVVKALSGPLGWS
ncbi:hypothetical protein Q5425_13790 [Amycolatopsis sp. A133]|uniref:hypothetical protein n=1 Tax=Amycolatopsis sp. A133 TaxID=3064472 RepID=UPI0027F7CC32|nr:hypothetical protein [Amycolatopsis sp. A133]MDQ7804814.1 hypothetical protein [Amycolatopsis sp. A133]